MNGTIDKAVILAAGRGSRIAAVGDTPKPWLPLSGKPGDPTFLDWHVAALKAVGVREIVLVGSPAAVARGLPRGGEGLARWLTNDREDVGSGHSASLAWADGVLDERSRVVLMDADLIYDPAILRTLAAAPGARSKILVHPEHRDSGEEVLVYGPWDAPLLQGKGLPGTPMAAGLDCLGEACGILLWEPGDHQALRAASAWTLAFSTAKLRSEHEDVTGQLLRRGLLEAIACPPGSRFLEVDTPEDYALMIRDYWPALAPA